MSLLGRLEDLSLPDIVQIVHLSRRTGILEILDGGGRSTVYFKHGLVVNASSREEPDLPSFLIAAGHVRSEDLAGLDAAGGGVSAGDYVLSRELMSPTELASAVRAHILSVVRPLTQMREGEFNFLLSERLDAEDIGYDSDALFKEGGLTPLEILGSEGERVKPLQGLEESMRVGKALLRGSATPSPPSPLDLGIGLSARAPAAQDVSPTPPLRPAPLPAPERDKLEGAAIGPTSPVANGEEAGEREPASPMDVEAILGGVEQPPSLPPAPVEEPPSGRGSSSARFRVGGEPALDDGAGMDKDRNVILCERDPLVRVAAKRAFSRRAARVFQFGTAHDTRAAVEDLLENNRFFVTFLDLGGEALDDDPAVRLMLRIKRKNRHLPVVVIDADADLRRRHAILEHGADLYLTRPSEAHLQPGLAEKSLAMFADELTLFAEKAFFDWEQLTGTLGTGSGEVGKRFYDIAQKERLNRSVAVVRQLINELSNPNEIREVGQTILRLAGEYADRAALFVATHRHFIGLGAYIPLGQSDAADASVRALHFRRDEPSVLREVAEKRARHRGKLQRSTANVALVESLGTIQPTEVIAIPIINEDRVLGVLYGDNANQRAPIDDTGSLEFFLAQAAFAFENAIIANARRKGIDWD